MENQSLSKKHLPENKLNSTRFLKFIAYLQIIGIVLVVFGHSFHEYPNSNHGTNLLIYRMLHSFRMPLFMFVSGFLMYYTTHIIRDKKPSFIHFFKTKVLRLILPFLVLTLITFVPRTMLSNMADDDLCFSFSSLLDSIIYGDRLVIPYYWFIQASFVLLVTTFGYISLAKHLRIPDFLIYALLFLLSSIPAFISINITMLFSLNMACRLAMFFVLGIIYCRYASYIDVYIQWTSVLFFATIVALWIILFFIAENTLYLNFCSLAGIIMCISIAKMLENKHINILDHLIGANYIIFLLSWYCNVLSQQVLHHYTNLPWYVYTILSLISGIYIPWLAYKYLQSHRHSRWVKFTALLLGQKLKNS